MRLDTKCLSVRTPERLCSLIVLWEREKRGHGAGGPLGGPCVRGSRLRAREEPGARQGAERALFGHEVRMTSEEALIGTRVRVHDSLERADLRGREGKILRRLGSPDYVALDVLLDDGTQELFWHHELDEVDGV